MGFICGLMLADVYVNRQRWIKKLESTPVGIGVLLVGLFLGSMPLQGIHSTFYRAFLLPGVTELQSLIIYLALGATLVIISVITNPLLKRIFGSVHLAVMGKYTFSLYLTHILVLLTLTPFLFVSFYPNFGYGWSALVSILLSIPAIVGVAWGFERYVDAPAIKLSAKLATFIDKGIAGESWRKTFVLRWRTAIRTLLKG